MRWWEIVGMEEPSGDTPSVSHSLDSSLREGAWMGAYHSTGYSLKSGVTGDFHRPYGTLKILGLYHSMCRSETVRVRAIFIAPTEGGFHSSCRPETGRGRAIFIAPTEALVILPFTIYWGVLSRVNWYFIISVWRSRCMTPSAILRMSRDATKARVFSASSRGTL